MIELSNTVGSSTWVTIAATPAPSHFMREGSAYNEPNSIGSKLIAEILERRPNLAGQSGVLDHLRSELLDQRGHALLKGNLVFFIFGRADVAAR